MKKFRRYVNNLIVFIVKELRGFKYNGFFKNLYFYSKGFTSKSVFLFEINRKNYKKYFSDFDRLFVNCNGEYRAIMDNKLLFYYAFSPYIDVPETYYVIKDNKIYPLGKLAENQTSVIDFLNISGKLILKPIRGMFGKGIKVLEKKDSYFLNEQPINAYELISYLGNCNGYFISEYIKQSEFADKFYYRTVNTLRLLTIFDNKTGMHTMPIGIMRIGNSKSYPVDNTDKGAISIFIDVQTGLLGRGVYIKNKKKYFCESHIDTHVKFKGEKIPNWNIIKNAILKTTLQFPTLKYIAWDVALTDNGFKLLEINNVSGFGTFQIHKPFFELGAIKDNYKMLFSE